MTGTNRYNIALVGAGRMGARWATVISQSRFAKLAIVVDTNEAHAKAVSDAHGARYSRRVKDALASDMQAVCIVTPHAYLFPIAKKALQAGKHVFVEKPGSKTAAEMRELIRLAQKKKRTLTVGFNYRFFDSIQKARALIERGVIGDVTALRIVHGHPGRRGYENEWRMNKKLAGGGVLIDQGLHLIDLARWFLQGPLASVSGQVSNRAWKTGVEDAASLVLRTKTGQLATLSVSISEWKPVFSLHIIGEKGYIAIDGLGRKYGDGTEFTLGRYDRKTEKLTERVIACNPDADEALRREFREFLDAMGKKELVGNARDAFEVLQIIETVYAKYR